MESDLEFNDGSSDEGMSKKELETEIQFAGQEEGPSQKLRLLLYAEASLTSFGERLWGFAIPLLLASLYPESMWPAASVALVETLAGFLSGPWVGASK